MVTQHYEIEIAYRREQMLADRSRVGGSRRQRRRAAALAAAQQRAAQPSTAQPSPARIILLDGEPAGQRAEQPVTVDCAAAG